MNTSIKAAIWVLAGVLVCAGRAQDAQKINAFLTNLQDVVLSVQAPGSTQSYPGKSNAGNSVIICTPTTQTLDGDLDSVTILDPTTGIVFPGALFRANQKLAEGNPVFISLDRGPITVSLDLPNMGDKDIRTIDNPRNSSVQAAIQDIVQAWLRDPENAQNGTGSRQSYTKTKAYSAEQVALQLGFSAKMANDKIDLKAKVSHDANSSVTMMLYKQIYYTATFDPPDDLATVFAPTVTLAQVQKNCSQAEPPAYVQSVDFGRLLLVKMTTSSTETSVDLEGAIDHAFGGSDDDSVHADMNAKYDQIISNSTFEVISLGGNAQDASGVMGGGKSAVAKVIKAIQDGANFNTRTPAFPIAYRVRFLADNAPAGMHFNLNYTQWDCFEHANGFVKVEHKGGYAARFYVTWQESAATGQGNDTRISLVNKSWESGTTTAGYSYTVPLPGDAVNVNIRAEADTLLPGQHRWQEAMNVTESGPTNKTYTVKGTTLNRSYSVSGPPQ
jgi:thiol-activated cytolysin